MTHNCLKSEKDLFPGISWCIFAPGTGVPVNPHAQGVQNMYDKGGKESKAPGNFQSVPCYRKGTDQKPPITRHFLLPSPLCHTHSEPSGHEDSPGPLYLGQKYSPKCLETNTFQVLGSCGSFSPPPQWANLGGEAR